MNEECNTVEEEDPAEIEEGEKVDREGKFLLYWMTTTSTSTSYLSTVTLSSLECTPADFTMSNCSSL